MDADDIVIGSGLAALATVIGLAAKRRVLVVGDEPAGTTVHYDAAGTVPCAHLGFGGLGNYWHGVIPVGPKVAFSGETFAAFEQLFHHFYPGAELAHRIGGPWLFVPWKPIRPQREWPRLAAERGGNLSLVKARATRFEIAHSGVSVHTRAGVIRASRVWVCAGALQTPRLLDRSCDRRVSRAAVSDHFICYLGQIDRRAVPALPLPRTQRTRHGLWIEARHDATGRGLCTLRPARFGFRRLDEGIEQRAVFGLPAASAIAKLLRVASPGLLAEALYNRFGLFPGARVQSAYAQIVVPDAYELHEGRQPLTARPDVIRAAVDRVRAHQPWPGVVPSRRPDVFIPAIHLHHSVDVGALHSAGLGQADSAVRVVDASVYEDIGPDHHSFQMMLAAAAAARGAAGP